MKTRRAFWGRIRSACDGRWLFSRRASVAGRGEQERGDAWARGTLESFPLMMAFGGAAGCIMGSAALGRPGRLGDLMRDEPAFDENFGFGLSTAAGLGGASAAYFAAAAPMRTATMEASIRQAVTSTVSARGAGIASSFAVAWPVARAGAAVGARAGLRMGAFAGAHVCAAIYGVLISMSTSSPHGLPVDIGDMGITRAAMLLLGFPVCCGCVSLSLLVTGAPLMAAGAIAMAGSGLAAGTVCGARLQTVALRSGAGSVAGQLEMALKGLRGASALDAVLGRLRGPLGRVLWWSPLLTLAAMQIGPVRRVVGIEDVVGRGYAPFSARGGFQGATFGGFDNRGPVNRRSKFREVSSEG